MRALCQGLEKEGSERVAAEYIGVHPLAIPSRYCGLTHVRREGLPQLSRADLRRDKMEDSVGRLVMHALKSQSPELLQKNQEPEAKILHKEWNQLMLKDGVLYRSYVTEKK